MQQSLEDLVGFADEAGAVYDKKTLLQLYNAATEEPVSFLYVKMASKNQDDMIYKRFDHKLVIIHE